METLKNIVNVLIFFALTGFIVANLVRLGLFFWHGSPDMG